MILHNFHIPVLGLVFTLDTPLKVARYGISSVVSIVDDIIIESVRKFHLEKSKKVFNPILTSEDDYRAKRITAYLNMLNEMIAIQFEEMKKQEFIAGSDLTKYFEMLPIKSDLKQQYLLMIEIKDDSLKQKLQTLLKRRMVLGSIDVNIMSKVDKLNLNKKGESTGDINSDALSALRGFGNSNLTSSLILSAGMNPRLYSYLESFSDFLPDAQQHLKKKIILKVSDFRSAFIQAKFLAKKGIWVSEFRVESGLNCGGHAFATEGFLLGPILEEFKNKRTSMVSELFTMYQKALETKQIQIDGAPALKITVQGGIGTADEHNFLLDYYQLDRAGWGSPFLLVPEATNVDEETLRNLVDATQSDFYISGSSPLGIPFNNFRKSSSEQQRLDRIAKNRPGSPCTKKFLVSNTEFTTKPICTASREYQNLKIKELENENLQNEAHQTRYNIITEKICLCEGLVNSFFKINQPIKPKQNNAVAICPGPNLAYFKATYTLNEMIKHIYGEINLLDGVHRSHVFINELRLYIDYLKKDISLTLQDANVKRLKYFENFKQQLQLGINYYKEIGPLILNKKHDLAKKFSVDLLEMELKLNGLNIEVG